MIFTDSTYRKISLYLIIAASFVFILLVILGISEYSESENKLQQKLSSVFIQSIHEQVKLKMAGEFVLIHHNNNQSQKKNRTQTVVTEDTIITKEAEVSGDMEVELFKGSQTYLLLRGWLKAQELQQVFDSTLQKNGLKEASVVLIRYNQNTLASGDTTQLSAYYRIPVVKGGVFDEITYEGLVNYSFFSVFRLMSKSMPLVIFLLEVVVLSVMFYFFVEKRKIKPDKIIKRGRYYYMGKTIFDIRKYELIGQKKEIVAVNNQPAEMLLMFLKSNEHVVEKNLLKETFWPDNSYTANQSLMSTINKLKNYLKDVDCAFTITTKRGDNHYTLKYMLENK